MVDVDTNVWDATLADKTDGTEYAGGGGAAPAALAEVSLIQGTDTLVAVDPIIAGSSFFAATAERNLDLDIGDDLYQSNDSTKNVPPASASIIAYLVTSKWFDYAISATKTKGDYPLTWTHHVDNAIEELDWFGCWVNNYNLAIVAGKETIQTVDCMSRGWKAGNAMTKVAYETGARAFGANASMTVDGITSANMVVASATLNINNNIDVEKGTGIGDQRIQQPRLGKRDVDLTITLLNRTANTWAADQRNTTAQLMNVTLVAHSTLTITMTNLYCYEHNEHEVQQGIKQHTYKFRQGAGFTIA